MEVDGTMQAMLQDSRKQGRVANELVYQINHHARTIAMVHHLHGLYGPLATLEDLDTILTQDLRERQQALIVEWADTGGLFVINHKGTRLLMQHTSHAPAPRLVFVDDEDFVVTIDPRTIRHVKMAKGKFLGAMELIV